MNLQYCKKCGDIAQVSYNDKANICYCCESKMYDIPSQCIDDEIDFLLDKNNVNRQRFIEEYIKTSPEFDQYLFDHREEIIDQKVADYKARMADAEALIAKHSKKSTSSISSVTCPYCNSTNTQKITATAKAVNTAVFGIFGTKRFKQWHCNKCGSDF